MREVILDRLSIRYGGEEVTTDWKYVKAKRKDILRVMLRHLRANENSSPVTCSRLSIKTEAGYANQSYPGEVKVELLESKPMTFEEVKQLFT